MLELKDFKKDKIVLYSSMSDKEYYKIKLIKITKRAKKRNIFWFDAKIIDNSTGQTDSSFHAIGSIHSYSNSFIYKTKKDLIAGSKKYITTQINWLKAGGYKIFM